MYRYKIKIDLYKDAWNWWQAINNSSHGVDWADRAPKEIADQVCGKKLHESYDILIPYLKEKYYAEKTELQKWKSDTQKEFEDKFLHACKKIEEVMKRPLYRDSFEVYATTFERGPYDKETGRMWHCIKWPEPIFTFVHEVCHFQFIHYWREDKNSEVSKLPRDQFEFLKESLTMIIDDEFADICSECRGYDIHQDFRAELRKAWDRGRDFKSLVGFGLLKLDKYF